MDKNKSPVLTVGVIIFTLGAMLFSIKFYAEWNGAVASGTITSIRERSETDSTGTRMYYEPSIWFITHTGDTVKDFIRNNQNVNRYKVGQKLSIVYKKDNVKKFHVKASFLWYILFVAISIAGIAVVYFSTKLESEKWD